MSNPVYRQCRKEDLPAVQCFVDDLYATDPGEESVNPNIVPTFDELQRHPEKGQVIVFELDGEPVGFAIIIFFWSNEFGGDVLEIDELLVAAQHRGKGIAREFFSWIESAYPQAVLLALQVSEQNTGAARLYESVGFKAARNHYLFKRPQRTAARAVQQR
jgi:GNAT superfamily N-acetyltransferase